MISQTIIAVLLALLMIAAVTDVARHKIYNWNTYSGIAAGFATRWFAEGWTGLEDGLAGFGACGGIMLVCYVLFHIGGGDVKLMAMIGAFLGMHDGIEAMLWTFVLGSIAAMAYLVWQMGLLRIISKGVQHALVVMRARSWVPLDDEEREPLRRRLHVAPSALVAVCVVVLW